MFTDVLCCINWLENLSKSKPRENLDLMTDALQMMGNLEDTFQKIHVCGTNGKGSTAAFISNILINAKFKVATFISPYVVSFNERIQINNKYISDSDLIMHTNIAKKIWDETAIGGEGLSFFETLTLVAISYFAAEKVQFAVIEVGMGGLLDATNAMNYDVSVITNIGLDHMERLGNTLEEIAYNKLGIVKKNNCLITTVDESLHDLFNDYCSKVGAKIFFIKKKDIYIYPCEMCSFEYNGITYDLNMMGIHQALNATLAIETVSYIFPQIKKKYLKRGLENAFWPGRLERVNLRPRVIIDGAHNIPGVVALKETLQSIYKNRHIRIVFAALKDKKTKEMLDILKEVTDDFVLTEFDYFRNKKALALEEDLSFKTVIINDPKEAVRRTILDAKDDDVIVVTGSLYFISIIRPMFR